MCTESQFEIVSSRPLGASSKYLLSIHVFPYQTGSSSSPRHPPPLTSDSFLVITLFLAPSLPKRVNKWNRFLQPSGRQGRVGFVYPCSLACFLCLAMSAARVSIGLVGASEVVFRGGYLKGPVVATGLKNVGGKLYLYLVKSNVQLCNFLAKSPARHKPLAKTSMFERIAAARDAKYKELLLVDAGFKPPPATVTEVATGLDPCDCLGMDVDAVDGLGMDATPKAVATGPRKTKHPRVSKKSRTVMPPAAEICLPRGGQPDLKLWVLMEQASKAPAMEATQDNLQALFDLVDSEITHGSFHRERFGVATAHLRPKPRGPKDAREYAVGNRWVTKMKVPLAAAATSLGLTSPSKAVKTLKRRRSDDTAVPPRRRKATVASCAGGDVMLDSLGL